MPNTKWNNLIYLENEYDVRMCLWDKCKIVRDGNSNNNDRRNEVERKGSKKHVNQRSNNPFRFVDTCDTLIQTHMNARGALEEVTEWRELKTKYICVCLHINIESNTIDYFHAHEHDESKKKIAIKFLHSKIDSVRFTILFISN